MAWRAKASIGAVVGLLASWLVVGASAAVTSPLSVVTATTFVPPSLPGKLSGTRLVAGASGNGRYVAYYDTGAYPASDNPPTWVRYDRWTGELTTAYGIDELSGDGRYTLQGPDRFDLDGGATYVSGIQQAPYASVNGTMDFAGDVYITSDAAHTNWIVDTLARTVTRAPVSVGGISGDGRWVGYTVDTCGLPRCQSSFIMDRSSGQSELVDTNAVGGRPSFDGRLVIYFEGASSLPTVLKVKDRSTGVITVWDHAIPSMPKLHAVAGVSSDATRVLYQAVDGYLYVADIGQRAVVQIPASNVGDFFRARLSADGLNVFYTAGPNAPAGSIAHATLNGRDVPSGPSGVTRLMVAGRGGVPAGAAAAVLNVTVTNPTGPGFVTVWPCDAAQPVASNLNYVPGQTIANAVLTKLAADGTACLYTLTAADLVVDVNGALTAGNTYTPLTPNRLLDTRTAPGTTASLGAASTTRLMVAGRGGVPAGAAAAVLNVTVTNPTGPGFVTVWPCDAAQPVASNLNYVPGQTIANAVLTKLAADGTACLYTLTAADLVVDVNGALTAGNTYTPLTPNRLLDTRGL